MAARQPQPDSGTTDVTHLSTQDEASMDAPPLHLESTAAAMSEAPSSDDGRDCRPDDHTTRTGEGATTADNQTGLSRSTEPFQVGLWRLEAAEERRRNHQPSGDGGADDSTVAAAVPTSPMNFSGTFREEPMHANMDSTTTLVTVYHKRGVSHVEVDASDFATGEKLKAFIRYKERKYDAVNRLNRICTFLVMFLFLNCMCRAIGLANESWFSMYFPLSGRREGYGVFRSCVNTVDIDTCHSWTTFPRALIEATCTVPHLHARIRTLWAFAIMDACAVGVASILALLTAFRPTRSKFHMAILILCFVSVPFGIITLALFRNLIGCVRGQCPALRGCEDGFGWGFTVYIVAVCASFIGASLASSMRSYVFVLRRTAKRELQLERRLQRADRRRGAVLETDDGDDNDNIGDDVELLRSDRVVAAGAATAGDSAGNSEKEDAQPDSASMPPRRNQQECNAPFGDGDSCTETPIAGRRASGEEGPLLCSPHHPTKRRESTVRLVSGGGDHHVVSSSEGGGGRKQQQHVRAFSGNDDGTIGAVLSPQNASYRSSSVHHMTGSSGLGPSARRGHSRQVSGASVGSNLSFGGFQFGAPASSASKHHMRGHSNGGDFASSTSFYSSGGGAPPPPQYITALEMGVEIDGADDWVYAEDGDMYYSFHLHMFWDPINHEYYNCTLKRWQESLEL